MLKSAGHQVSLADSWPLTVTGLSRAVSRRFVVPPSRLAFPGFADALARIVRGLLPDVVVPTCEEVFWVARAKESLEPFTRVACPPLPLLRRLHDKFAFAQQVRALGLRAPETQLLVCEEDVDALASRSRELVFKPAYARFGTRTLVRPTPRALQRSRPSQRDPWVAQDCRDDAGFRLFTGSELMVDTALMIGAHGCVPGLGNVDPAAYVALYDAARREDWRGARQIQERLSRLFAVALQGTPRTSAGASGVGGFKAALNVMGLITHHHMNRPNLPLSDQEVGRVANILKAEGI